MSVREPSQNLPPVEALRESHVHQPRHSKMRSAAAAAAEQAARDASNRPDIEGSTEAAAKRGLTFQ